MVIDVTYFAVARGDWVVADGDFGDRPGNHCLMDQLKLAFKAVWVPGVN